MKQFIAVDGEGQNEPDGSHSYTMLCASDGSSIEAPSLNSYDCFEYLLQLQEWYPKAAVVGFSFNYDTNMMLKDVPKNRLKVLWDDTKVSWFRNGIKYYLEWIPQKYFKITTWRYNVKRHVTVWDVFGFFQSSFVNALRTWNVCEAEETDEIERMKEQRGDFEHVESSAIKAYCQHECTLLVRLMEKLDDAFRTADIPLNRYDGAGAAASALLRKHHVKQHIQQFDSDIQSTILCAYFGGRTEIFRVGECGPGYNYDINSAYPAATLNLPSLADGTWKELRNYDPTVPYAIWFTEWQIEPSNPLAPLPFRSKRRIHYVYRGCGWYHSVEVNAAVALYGTERVRPRYGIQFVPRDDSKPFAFVADLYTERQHRKATGDPSEKPIKLALNSIYGKTAQGVSQNGIPPLQSYFWAGLITATTRATILTAVYPYREKLIGIATDGIFTTEEIPNLALSNKLGEWERKRFDSFFSAQPGVYQYERDGTRVSRNRGFSTKELNFDDLRADFRRNGIGTSITYYPVRFVGYGGANPALTDWCRWLKRPRRLTVSTGTKWQSETDPHQLVLGSMPEGSVSEKYVPKHGSRDIENENDIQEDLDSL